MKVAIAVIYNSEQQILITKRAAHIPHGGFWEFPGGKLESHETPEAALLREIKEEVGLDVIQYDFLSQIDEPREKDTLSLFVFLIHQFHGEAKRLESQADLMWVKPHELRQFQFPATNQSILTWIDEHFSSKIDNRAC
ncbi:MAG: 8-oxo-dGTP diphosphatase MutT [Legionella sp.]|nr:MAG: 8-oxo-dGTP diphosphatase MutT [Legionella sp.]